MILAQVRGYLQTHRRVALYEPSLHFDTDPEALRGMLAKWEAEGRVAKLPPLRTQLDRDLRVAGLRGARHQRFGSGCSLGLGERETRTKLAATRRSLRQLLPRLSHSSGSSGFI